MSRILRLSLLVGLSMAFTLGFAFSAFGGEIFQKDFTQSGESGLSDMSGLETWTGDPVDSWGKVTIEPLPAKIDGAPKKALTVYTNSTNPSAPDGSKFCPAITIQTPGCGASGEAKTAVYLLKFFVPIDGSYRTDIHFGGNWDSNAAILVLGSGKLSASVNGTPTLLGDYTVNTWQELQVEFDCAGKTYSAFLNGKKVANAIPWNNATLSSVNSFLVVAGAMSVEKDATPVLYIDKIDISEK